MAREPIEHTSLDPSPETLTHSPIQSLFGLLILGTLIYFFGRFMGYMIGPKAQTTVYVVLVGALVAVLASEFVRKREYRRRTAGE